MRIGSWGWYTNTEGTLSRKTKSRNRRAPGPDFPGSSLNSGCEVVPSFGASVSPSGSTTDVKGIDMDSESLKVTYHRPPPLFICTAAGR